MKIKNTIIEKIVEKRLGNCGNLLSSSKSIYLYENSKNLVAFNANVCTKEDGKIWYGDIDITDQFQNIKKLAKDLGKTVYILCEMAARFANEKLPDYENFIAIVTKDGAVTLPKNDALYLVYGVPHVKTNEEIEASKPKKDSIVENESDYEPVDLPDLKSIKVTKKIDPLNAFWKIFIDKLGKDSTEELFSKLFVTRDYHQKLEKKVENFTKKMYPYLHPAKIKQTVAFHMFDLAPKAFENTQKWEKPNVGYVKK